MLHQKFWIIVSFWTFVSFWIPVSFFLVFPEQKVKTQVSHHYVSVKQQEQDGIWNASSLCVGVHGSCGVGPAGVPMESTGLPWPLLLRHLLPVWTQQQVQYLWPQQHYLQTRGSGEILLLCWLFIACCLFYVTQWYRETRHSWQCLKFSVTSDVTLSPELWSKDYCRSVYLFVFFFSLLKWLFS